MECEMRDFYESHVPFDPDAVIVMVRLACNGQHCDDCPYHEEKWQAEEASRCWRNMAIDLGAADRALELRQEYMDELQAERDKLRELVRKMEWALQTPCSPTGFSIDTCPRCRRKRHKGHAPDCELAKALGGVNNE